MEQAYYHNGLYKEAVIFKILARRSGKLGGVTFFYIEGVTFYNLWLRTQFSNVYYNQIRANIYVNMLTFGICWRE